jgi:nicotinamidase-related amidase
MKKALIVVDMQNDYLWDKRKENFSYDTNDLVSRVNEVIHEYQDNGADIIYIKHIIQNLPSNKVLFGFSLEGTEGAEIYKGLDVVSDNIFIKHLSDSFRNKELRKFVKEKGYEEIYVCGLDQFGCVGYTAIGATKQGLKSFIVKKGTATILPEKKILKMHNKLDKAGVSFI